jgi:hypothetical protein
MSQYVELAAKAGDQYLEVLAKAQEAYLGAIAQFTKQMPHSAGIEGMPVGVPAEVPAVVREAVEASLSFAQKALDQQKAYMEKLLTSAEATTDSKAKA